MKLYFVRAELRQPQICHHCRSDAFVVFAFVMETNTRDDNMITPLCENCTEKHWLDLGKSLHPLKPDDVQDA
jgi:hypothetical protein